MKEGKPLLGPPAEGRVLSQIWRYSLALVFVGLAFGIRSLLDPWLAPYAPFIIFIPSIIIVAWSGGVGPALLAILTTFLLTQYFLPHPPARPSAYLVAELTHIVTALIVVGLVNAVRKRENAMARSHEALRQNEELLRLATEGAKLELWNWVVATDILECPSFPHLGLPTDRPVTFSDYLTFVDREDRGRLKTEMANCLQEHREFNVQFRVRWLDGSVHWRHSRGRPYYVNDRPIRVIGMSMDITERKQAEQSLQEAKSALATHARRLEQRVTLRTNELQRSLKDMESFCYTIAHDLRAPLRSITGFAHSLAEDYLPQLGEAGRDFCQRIIRSADRMNQLISDLLAYGRLTNRQLPMQFLDLNAEVEKVLERAAPQIEETAAQVQVDKPLPTVCGDGPVLDQVLENLITNAVKFVPPGTRPLVHIFARHSRKRVRLCIEDNGIGIPPEYREKIFLPFERLHTPEAYPGTGIGLAIVQRGVEKMGGQVRVESAPGRGSRFWIDLPGKCRSD